MSPVSNDRTTSHWPALVGLGVLCGVTLGLVLFVLLRRRDGALQSLPEPTGGIDTLDLDELMALPVPATRGGRPVQSIASREVDGVSRRSVTPPAVARATYAKNAVARTVAVSDTSPTMITQATGPSSWNVWCRTVGPPGAFAAFMLGANRSEMVWIPAGQAQRVILPRGEFLYAIGDRAGVSVSVSGGTE